MLTTCNRGAKIAVGDHRLGLSATSSSAAHTASICGIIFTGKNLRPPKDRPFHIY